MENSFDGDRSTTGYAGDPRIRGFVPGEEDARDEQLKERIESEERIWQGRIFTVDRLQVSLPDGRPAIREDRKSVV